MSARDTIAAPATAPGPAAVGIVRISGPAAFAVGRKICARWSEPVVPARAFFTPFVEGEVRFDSGLALPFAGPASYTGEDVLELHGHGGHASRRLLAAVCASGARLAEPGEFTERAFLAGKLDLVQAEAVAKVIAAQTDRALQVAQASLGGTLSRELSELERLLEILRGRVEGLLDFPSEASGAEAGLGEDCAALCARIDRVAQSFARGRRLFSRTEVVLVGPVNAGKSSLLNALCGEERALVDPAPGTTRDLVAADVEIEGIPLRLVDTAGWREAIGVEARGIARGRAAAERAELVLWVSPVDAFEPPPDSRWLAVASKCDLASWRAASEVAIAVSTVSGAGLDALRGALHARLVGEHPEDALVVTGERQAQGLVEASSALARAGKVSALELIAEELALAQRALARVRGIGEVPESLDEVFRQFCIGK